MKFSRKKGSDTGHIVKQVKGGLITMRCGYAIWKKDSACLTDSRPPMNMLCKSCEKTISEREIINAI